MYKAARILSTLLLCFLLVSVGSRSTIAQAVCVADTTLDKPWDFYDYDFPSDNPIPWKSWHKVQVQCGDAFENYEVNFVGKHLLENTTLYEVGFPNIPYDQPEI